jgi:EF hand/EF-hand domain pair
MRRRLGALTITLGLAAGALGVAAHGSAAQGQAHMVGGFTQLFVSPAGEPYRGKPGDAYPVALWFKQADLNHDGVITRDEFRADHKGFFEALDYDDAGYLDGPKIAFYESKVLPDLFAGERVGMLTPNGPRKPGIELAVDVPGRDGAQLIRVQQGSLAGMIGGPTNQDSQTVEGAKGPIPGLGARRPVKKELVGAAAYGLLQEAEPIRAADTNLDGLVSKAEFMAAADRRFALLDKRHDGKLTLDELPQTSVQIELAQQERRGKR